MEVDAAERLALYEDRWKSGGLAFYNIYPDVYWDKAANDTLSDFLRGKIRERVKDPAIAEKLMPTFPALTKRLMADTNYYETYNRDNVTLVDINDTPIEEFTAKGVRIAGVEHEFDSIVFATGFDALTGTLIRLDIKGRGGATMQEHWDGGARTHLGLMCADFPNMFILSAAGSPAVLFQPILLCEEQVNWVGNCIQFLARYGFSSLAPTSESEDNWGKLCTEAVERTLFPLTNSWYLGKNIPGKSSTGMIYFGGMGNYRKHLADAEAGGYSDFVLTVPSKATST
jgi:cyclohexanone monooxygenase